MTFAHKGLPKETFKRPEGVYSATISKISGKLVGTSTPEDIRVSSIFAVKPTEYENSLKEVEVDMLCNGKVTERTPESAIKRGYLMNANPIIDSYDPTWLGSVRSWLARDSNDE
jgi:membrane carboxypeptidase/penicillin-binding protein